MSRFYLTMNGGKSNSEEVTRRGYSGNEANVAGWSGAIETSAYDRDGEDWVRVYLKPWQGSEGTRQLIYDGPLDAHKEIVSPATVASPLPPSIPDNVRAAMDADPPRGFKSPWHKEASQ